LKHKKNTVIILCGPTAVGKTSLSLQLAKHFKTSIISADSRQCFKELNIGVAKPTEQELFSVKHYFVNSHSINEEVNAMVFEKYALEKSEEIFSENNIAVMVGGTGLYLKAFCQGMDEMPNVPKKIRENIIAKYEAEGIDFLQKELQKKDSAFWQIAEQQNPQRLMRALEIFEATGKSIAEFKSSKKKVRDFDIIKLGLELPREKLYQHINTRVDKMMSDGLLKEVESLIKHKSLNALQTVGYKELFDFIENKISLDKAVELIKKNTRHYAKRQMTWFKKDSEIKWIDVVDSYEIIKNDFLEPLK
jgi:tRNA dimethylallyltransferase